MSHIGISDHSLIYVYRKLSIDPPSRGHTTVTYRKFKNFNSSNFRYDIACQNWQIINNYDDPNDMWDAWKNLFLFCVDKHAPYAINVFALVNHLGLLLNLNSVCMQEIFLS